MTDLEVGQRWTYNGPPQSVRSTLIIGAVESNNGATVVHIAVENFESASSPEPFGFGHLPFTEEAIASSVLELVETNVVIAESLGEGIDYWRSQAGGVFATSVIEALEGVVQAHPAGPDLGDNFDELVAELRAKQDPTLIEGIHRQILGLEQWFFISDPSEPRAPVQWTFPDGPNPEPAVLAFTSRQRALLAADQLGLYPAGTDMPVMAPSVAEAVQWIASDGFANGWLCFNLTQQDFPFYADDLVAGYNAFMQN